MDTKLVKEVTDWLKTTDLAEFCYGNNGDSLEIKTSEALPEPAQFQSALVSVCSPAIGVYHAAEKGKSLPLSQGQKVEQGDLLGWIETVGKKHKVTVPCAGQLQAISVQEGAVVEFGLPLFFIEP